MMNIYFMSPPPDRKFATVLAGTGLLLVTVLAGCTARPIDQPDIPVDISGIRIIPKPKPASGNVASISRCSGFSVTEKEVHHFLTHAARHRSFTPDNSSHRLLPCAATGSAVLNNRRYQWTIRAGGLGELSADKDRFNLVCGKGCCDKVPGIC